MSTCPVSFKVKGHRITCKTFDTIISHRNKTMQQRFCPLAWFCLILWCLMFAFIKCCRNSYKHYRALYDVAFNHLLLLKMYPSIMLVSESHRREGLRRLAFVEHTWKTCKAKANICRCFKKRLALLACRAALFLISSFLTIGNERNDLGQTYGGVLLVHKHSLFRNRKRKMTEWDINDCSVILAAT